MKSWHVLNILHRLLQKQSVCVKAYAQQHGRSIRSVQRDIEALKEFYEEFLIRQGDCYLMTDTDTLSRSISGYDELKSVIDLYSLLHPNIYDRLDSNEQMIAAKLQQKEAQTIFLKQPPYEMIEDNSLIKSLKSAIRLRRYCTLHYSTYKDFVFSSVKPIRIVLFEGNWYVAVIDKSFTQNNGFRWLRISYLTQVVQHKETFISDPDAQSFIKNSQNLFSAYKKPAYEVTVTIHQDAARFFRAKKHLKTQQIIGKNEDGSLLARFEISNEMEILPLIKKWIPHITVLSPQNLKDRLLDDIETFKKQLKY